MNIKYDFTETGGFPLDQGIMNDEQNGILQVEKALANLLGPLAIISGCVVTGGSAANGVVAINGEILPFVGGIVGSNVLIVETDSNLTYGDLVPRPSKITRYATFGIDGVQINPWANFVSGSLSQWQTGDIKEIDCTEAYITANFVVGGGTDGLGKNLRLGWAICNGNNGTVNRMGKVPVQRDPSETEFATMGTTGGAKAHTLIASDIPPLATDAVHSSGAGGGNGIIYAASQNPSLIIPVNSGSANNPVSLLQPYITTLFIQKL